MRFYKYDDRRTLFHENFGQIKKLRIFGGVKRKIPKLCQNGSHVGYLILKSVSEQFSCWFKRDPQIKDLLRNFLGISLNAYDPDRKDGNLSGTIEKIRFFFAKIRE